MSIWIVASPFSAEEEKRLARHTQLKLPFDGLPDLTGVDSEAAMRRLLIAMQPEAPPETVARQADTHWRRYSQLAAGDLMVLPLTNGTFALAEMTLRYRYRVEAGKDVHEAEVKWLDTAIPKRKLAALAPLVAKGSAMLPIEQAEARKPVYALLKRPYNRFVKWRWILAVAIAMQMAIMLLGMFKNLGF